MAFPLTGVMKAGTSHCLHFSPLLPFMNAPCSQCCCLAFWLPTFASLTPTCTSLFKTARTSCLPLFLLCLLWHYSWSCCSYLQNYLCCFLPDFRFSASFAHDLCCGTLFNEEKMCCLCCRILL